MTSDPLPARTYWDEDHWCHVTARDVEIQGPFGELAPVVYQDRILACLAEAGFPAHPVVGCGRPEGSVAFDWDDRDIGGVLCVSEERIEVLNKAMTLVLPDG